MSIIKQEEIRIWTGAILTNEMSCKGLELSEIANQPGRSVIEAIDRVLDSRK